MDRRIFLLSGIAMTAAGCAESPTLDRPYALTQKDVCSLARFGYPTPHELAEQLAPTVVERNLFTLNIRNYELGNGKDQFADLLSKYMTKLDGTIVFPAEEIDHYAKDKADIRHGPWQVTIETYDVLFGFKHLSVTLSSALLARRNFRFEGVAARPWHIPYEKTSLEPDGQIKFAHPYDENEIALDVFSDGTLFGLIDNALKNNRNPMPQYSFSIDYSTALNFISRVAQFTLEFDSLAVPYELWTRNSNSYTYSLLKHGLGDHFNERDFNSLVTSREWKLPGYGNLLLPEIKFDPDYLIRPNEIASDVITRILNKKSPPTSVDCLVQAKKDLVQRQLTPFRQFLEIGNKPIAAGSVGPIR